MLILLAASALAAAVAIAADWTHRGDSSCGALYRSSELFESGYCGQMMTSRLIAVLALVGAAALAVILHAQRSHRTERGTSPR
jgi:hypothetical protein